MRLTPDSLLPNSTNTDDVVTAVHHQDIVAAWSATMAAERVAVLHML